MRWFSRKKFQSEMLDKINMLECKIHHMNVCKITSDAELNACLEILRQQYSIKNIHSYDANGRISLKEKGYDFVVSGDNHEWWIKHRETK
jgi:hypothetical protein